MSRDRSEVMEESTGDRVEGEPEDPNGAGGWLVTWFAEFAGAWFTPCVLIEQSAYISSSVSTWRKKNSRFNILFYMNNTPRQLAD